MTTLWWSTKGNEPVEWWALHMSCGGVGNATHLHMLGATPLDFLHPDHLTGRFEIGAHVQLHLVRRSIDAEDMIVVLELLQLASQ